MMVNDGQKLRCKPPTTWLAQAPRQAAEPRCPAWGKQHVGIEAANMEVHCSPEAMLS